MEVIKTGSWKCLSSEFHVFRLSTVKVEVRHP